MSIGSISNFINVSIVASPTLATVPNVNTAALFTVEQPDPSFTYKIYKLASDVSDDWGTSSNVFKIATAFFNQMPNPLITGGYLVVIPLASSGAEKVETAIARTLNSVYYNGVLVDQDYNGNDSDYENLTEYVQSVEKTLYYCSSHQADYNPGGIMYVATAAGLYFTRQMYYSTGTQVDTYQFAAAYCSRNLSTDFNGSNTCVTMSGKSLIGFVADPTMDQTELTLCKAAGVDIYWNFGGNTCIYTSGANLFTDQVYNRLAFKLNLQTSGFNYVNGTATKIPQTENGMNGLKNTYARVCQQFVRNGYLAPGSWTSSVIFGNSDDLIRNVGNLGYYIYSTPISQQSQSDREQRIAPLVQMAVKEAGAIQSSSVVVFVNN